MTPSPQDAETIRQALSRVRARFEQAESAGALPVSNRHDGTRTLADVDAEMAGINWRGE